LFLCACDSDSDSDDDDDDDDDDISPRRAAPRGAQGGKLARLF